MALYVPTAVGVPGYYGLPPNFLQSYEPKLSTIDNIILDPRWNGALRLVLGPKTTDSPPYAYCRLLRATEGSTEYLYVMLHQAFCAGSDVSMDEVRFFISTGTGYQWGFRYTPGKGSVGNVGDPPVTPAPSDSTFYVIADGNWKSLAADAGDLTSMRSWYQRVPNSSSNQVMWALALRIPISNSDTYKYRAQLNGSGQFYFAAYFVNTVSGAVSITELDVPKNSVAGSGLKVPDPTSVSTWQQLLASGAPPTSTGVSAARVRISHTTPTATEDTQIVLSSTAGNTDNIDNNQFVGYCSGAEAAGVTGGNATFQLAGWGSTIADFANETRKAAAWHQVASSTSFSITAEGEMRVSGKWNDADYQTSVIVNKLYPPFSVTGSAAGTAHTDQCVYATFNAFIGGGTPVPIVPDSLYQNMLFAGASTFERQAQISLLGSENTDSTTFGDVYFLVELFNMPSTITVDNPKLRALAEIFWNTKGKPFSDDCAASKNPLAPLADSFFDQIREVVPTFIVHPFRATGKTTTINGKQVPVVESMNPWGGYFKHDGPLCGWDYGFDGAVNIGGYWWKARVVNNGVANITTRVRGMTTPTDRLPHTRETSGINMGEACLYTKNSLAIADRVKIMNWQKTDYATVVNAGTSQTNIGVEAQVGDVISVGQVLVRNRGKVNGKVVSGQPVSLQDGAVVTEGTGPISATYVPTLALQVNFASGSHPAITLNSGQSADRAPGDYGAVTVSSNATLRLTSGVYRFESFGIESAGKVVLDCANGAVFIYVHGNCYIRGDITEKSGTRPDLFFVCVTTGTVSIERPFAATLVVPNGGINLATLHGGEYSGAFFAKDISIQPDNVIRHVPYAGQPSIGV